MFVILRKLCLDIYSLYGDNVFLCDLTESDIFTYSTWSIFNYWKVEV